MEIVNAVLADLGIDPTPTMQVLCMAIMEETSRAPFLEEMILSFYRSKPCTCLDSLPDSDVVFLGQQCWEVGRFECRDVLELLLFIQERRLVIQLMRGLGQHPGEEKKQPREEKKQPRDEKKQLKHQFPRRRLSKPETCGICMLEMPVGAFALVTACGHSFHFDDCLGTGQGVSRWLGEKGTCPMCRSDVQPTAAAFACHLRPLMPDSRYRESPLLRPRSSPLVESLLVSQFQILRIIELH